MKTNNNPQQTIDLYETIERKINEKFEYAKNFYKDTIFLSLKILAAILVLLAAFLITIGVNKSDDIVEFAKNYGKEQVDIEIKGSDVYQYQDEINEMYNNALIKTKLLDIFANNTLNTRKAGLSQKEKNTLIKIIKTSKDSYVLSNSIFILRNSLKHSEWNEYSKEIIEHAIPDDYKAKYKSENLETILNEISKRGGSNLNKRAINFLFSDLPNQKVVYALLNYIKHFGDKTAIKHLRDFSYSPNLDIQINNKILESIAFINPRHPMVMQWFDEFKKITKPSLQEILIAYTIGITPYLKNSDDALRFTNQEVKKEFRDRLKYLFEYGLKFSLLTYPTPNKQSLTINGVRVDSKILFGYGMNAINDILNDYIANKDIESVKQVLKAITIPITMDASHLIIRVRLSPYSNILTVNQRTLNLTSAFQGGIISITSTDKRDKLMVTWVDSSSGIKLSEEVQSISNHLYFTIINPNIKLTKYDQSNLPYNFKLW